MVTGMEKPYVVGMDIGGANTVFGVVDSRGNVLATDSVKTQSYSKIEDYVEAVCTKLRPLIESFGGVEKIKGMGVGAPNGNYYNGTIEFAPNLPWRGVIPLAALFEEKIGVPTALTNDANAAAIGEMTYGAARGMKDFIMITLGTGVGSGIVVNGQCMDMMVLQASSDMLSCVVKTDANAVAVVKVAWKLIAQLPVWHAQLVNSWLHVPNLLC